MTTRRVAELALLTLLVGLLSLVAGPGSAAWSDEGRHSAKPPRVSVRDVTVVEGTGAGATATFMVTAKKPKGTKLTVRWRTLDGTATAPADYRAAHGTLVFKGAKRTQRRPVAIRIQGDSHDEGVERLRIRLTFLRKGATRRVTATATIVDDDATPVMRRLSVGTSGFGTGTITSTPAGITCPGTCAMSVPDGTVVTLTADPGANSAFQGWIGACTGLSPTCTLAVTGDAIVSASFQPTRLDYTLPPTAGSRTLAAGFVPDPSTASLSAGGPVDVSYLGGGCSGFTTVAPTFRLTYSGVASLLRLYYVGSGDGVLVVNDPYGNFRCVDDSFGTTHPTLDFANPAAGGYDIWIGTRDGTRTTGVFSMTGKSTNHP